MASLYEQFVELTENTMELGDVTRAELARRLGVSRARVSQMMNGHYPNLTLETVEDVADAIGMPIFFSHSEQDCCLPMHTSEEISDREAERRLSLCPDCLNFDMHDTGCENEGNR